MMIEIVERKLIPLSDGRTLSLHPGVIDCEEKLAKELLDAGHARKPSPPKKPPILKAASSDPEHSLGADESGPEHSLGAPPQPAPEKTMEAE